MNDPTVLALALGAVFVLLALGQTLSALRR